MLDKSPQPGIYTYCSPILHAAGFGALWGLLVATGTDCLFGRTGWWTYAFPWGFAGITGFCGWIEAQTIDGEDNDTSDN